jgi:hypothetical protein
METPALELRALARAWRLIVKRAKRKLGLKTLPYMAFVESTKRGHPHLHILSRVRWIDFADLSKWAGEIINSPIVNIQRVKSSKHAIWYVTKYCGKAPAKFGTAKRYWMSLDWDIGGKQFKDRVKSDHGAWEMLKCDLNALWLNLEAMGNAVWLVDGDTIAWQRVVNRW